MMASDCERGWSRCSPPSPCSALFLFLLLLLSLPVRYLGGCAPQEAPGKMARCFLRSLMGCTMVPGLTMTGARVVSRTVRLVFHSLPTGSRSERSYCSRDVKGYGTSATLYLQHHRTDHSE